MMTHAKRTTLVALVAVLPMLISCGSDDPDEAPPTIETFTNPSPTGTGAISTTLFVTNMLEGPLKISLLRPGQYVTPNASPTTGKVTHDLQANGSFSLSATIPAGVEFAVEWGPTGNTTLVTGTGTCTFFANDATFRSLRIQVVRNPETGDVRANCVGFTLGG